MPRSADTVCGVVSICVKADMSGRLIAFAIGALSILLQACTSDSHERAAPPQNGRFTDENWRTINDRVLFAYDSAVIAAEYEQQLRMAAHWLIAYRTVTVTIEGHADERGTREYNLALGDRRAIAVKRALVALGVAADRLSTVSYRKERPAVIGSTEVAWSQNRRAVMVIN